MSHPTTAKLATALVYDVAATVRELRRAKGLSQMELALRAGVEQPAISRFERGVGSMTLTKLDKIAGALDLQVSLQLVPRAPGG